jgi:hypothetical protein
MLEIAPLVPLVLPLGLICAIALISRRFYPASTTERC